MKNTIAFAGKIPQYYQDLLTPFLFDGFSAELIKQIDFSSAYNVLELASGTGSTTKALLEKLPSGAHLTATDLEVDMLNVAKSQILAPNISWDAVDMTKIPYIDGQYDLIICQFGLMLVPEKLKALKEMHRVLKKGGRLIFSVWAEISQNPVWETSGKVIESFLGANPMLQNPGPFSLSNKHDVLILMEEAGFENQKTIAVNQTGNIESAAMAAKGMVQGLPVFMAINKKDPKLVSAIEQALEEQLSELNNHPFTSPLKAWVFETIK